VTADRSAPTPTPSPPAARAKLRLHNFSVSLDGYGAGPAQDLDNPLGRGGLRLHEWLFGTSTFHRMNGTEGGQHGLDDEVAARGDAGIGATIMGRNMFGPVRGPWGADVWNGWWGDNPPFHHPVFVLTHHPRSPQPMAGGTTFYFVTGGIEAALAQAFDAAGGLDVRLGGGAATVRQYLRAGLLEEAHLAIVPVLLGSGERLLDGLGDAVAAYTCTGFVSSPAALHVRLVRVGEPARPGSRPGAPEPDAGPGSGPGPGPG
jgi:dihydrofolate reductase